LVMGLASLFLAFSSSGNTLTVYFPLLTCFVRAILQNVGEGAVQLCLFGLPRLLVNGSSLRFPSRKGLALLIFLALEGVQSRERLARLLWTDSPNPKDALRNALAQVNKVLHSANLPSLVATRQSVVWAAPNTDALQLEQQPSETLLRGLGMWLEGFVLDGAPEFEDWALERGAYFSGLLQQHLERTADRCVTSGRLEDGLLLAQQRLRLDVLNENAYQQLMRLQRLAGRENEARETLLLCRTTLERELGMTPSAKTLGVFHEPLPRLQVLEPLFGREADLIWLESHPFVLLLGESGTGKTALLRRAQPSAIWLECRPNDPRLPYSSVLRAVRKRLREVELPDWARLELARFLPELGEVPNIPLEKIRLHQAFDVLFLPHLGLVVDDLHNMDEQSAAWLWQLLEQRQEERSQTVLAYRPDELPSDYSTALSQVERLGAKKHSLRPLNLPAVVQWLLEVGLSPQLAAEFVQLTAGNALHLKEAMLAYKNTGSLGQGLLPLLKQRLQALPALEWQLVQVVSLAQNQANLSLATKVLNIDPLQLAQAWARLERLEVLREASLSHDLLLQAALELTPATVQEALAASIFEQMRLENTPKSVLAELAQRAKKPAQETRLRLEAALEVYRMGFIGAGLLHFSRLLSLLRHNPDLLDQSQLEQMYFGLLPIYRAAVYAVPDLELQLEQLATLARQRSLLALEALALASQADWLAQVKHDFATARRLFDQALSLSNDPRLRHAVFEMRSWCENATGYTRLALEYAQKNLPHEAAIPDPEMHYRALEAVFMFEQNLGRWTDAMQHAQAASRAAAQAQRPNWRAYSQTMTAFCALQLGDLTTAEREVKNALETLQKSQWDNGLAFAERTLALLLWERDELSLALEYAQKSLERNAALKNHFVTCSCHTIVARIHLAAVRPELALSALEAAEVVLAQLSGFGVSGLMQSFIDSLRCHALTLLGQPVLPTALRAISARAEPPETTSWLILAPREFELKALVAAGQTQLAQRELEAFLALHPDNLRVQVLHLRARAVFEPTQLETARRTALELGLAMQARTMV
jgi:DNA-binding SARP family transcriptional activator